MGGGWLWKRREGCWVSTVTGADWEREKRKDLGLWWRGHGGEDVV